MEITRAKIISNCKAGDTLIHRLSNKTLKVLGFEMDPEGNHFLCEDETCHTIQILFPISLPHFDILKLS